MNLCIYINADTRFQFDSDAVIPECDLLDPASHQCFIEFCKIGGLLRNVILQVVNSLYLFISCGCINGCFLAKFSESEDLIRYFIVVRLAVTIQTVFIFFIACIASKILGMSHDIAAPAGMIGASNFFELAVAVAITLFGTTSPVALATTVGVLTEVPVMLALVKVANNTKGWFKS